MVQHVVVSIDGGTFIWVASRCCLLFNAIVYIRWGDCSIVIRFGF